MIMRVQEATAQQARLVSTGKYKDVQRSNIKFATKLMLDNYKLFESVDRASRLAPPGKQAEAMEKGRSAAENLQTLLECVPRVLRCTTLVVALRARTGTLTRPWTR